MKISIEPEHDFFEDGFPFPGVFSGSMFIFRVYDNHTFSKPSIKSLTSRCPAKTAKSDASYSDSDSDHLLQTQLGLIACAWTWMIR